MSSYPPPGQPGIPSGKTQTLNLDYNVAGLLSYVPCCIGLIASIIWMVTEPKESHFVRFHALQSLLLHGVGFAIGIVFWILRVAAFAGPSDLGGGIAAILLGLVQLAISLVLLLIVILAMVKAYQGQKWKIPVIGDIAEKNS